MKRGEGKMGGEGKERKGKGLKPPQSKFFGCVAAHLSCYFQDKVRY